MRPNNVTRYLELTREINKLSKEQKSLRPEVLTFLEETGGDDEIYLNSKTKTTWHEDVIYDWVKDNYPSLLSEVSKVTVDLEKFSTLIKSGKIDASKVPLTISTDTPITEIRTRSTK